MLRVLAGVGMAQVFTIIGWAAQGDPQNPLVIATKIGVDGLTASAIPLQWRRENGWAAAGHGGSAT